MARGAKVRIYGDWDGSAVKKAKSDLGAFDKSVQTLGKTFAALGIGIGAAGIVRFAADAVKAGSDLAESQSKVSVVFGDQAKIVQDWAKKSATAIGQTEQQALEAAGTYGNLFQAFGLTQTAAQDMSMTMVELAADLASFNNTSIDDAIEALRSGLSGETEPLKRFGIALNDARMKQEALALGIYDGTGALNAAQKAQAAYAVILNDTTLAQGDFERTSDGLANQQRILQAQFGNLTAQLGTMLLPVVLNVVNGLNGLVTGTQSAITAVQENSRAVVIATASIAALTTAIALNRIGGIAFALQYAAHTVQLGAYTIAARGAAIATATLSATMRMIPFVAVIAGLTALVTELDKGADESAKLREEVYRTARATRELTDANGNLTQSTVNAAKQGRFYRGIATELSAAISGTVGAAVAAGKAMSSNLTPNTYDAADAADKASKSYLELWEAIWNAKNAASDLANTSGTVTSALAQGARTGGVREYWQSLTVAYGETEKAARGVGSATAEITEKQEKFNQKLKEKQDALKTAIQGAKDYAVSVAKTFTDALDLSSALDAAKESGKSIVDEFIAQGERMGKFAENMQKLLAANLSRPAFDAIIRAGVERGADIADALAKGNIDENVRNVNRVYASVAQMGDIVGQRASYNFEQAGIITAQGFLENFIREFMPAGRKRRQLLASIDEMVNAALQNMSRMMNVPMPSVSGGGGGNGGGGGGGGGGGNVPLLFEPHFVQVPNFAADPFYASAGPAAVAAAIADSVDAILMSGGIPMFADGGIVTRPTLGIVGEAGPEAIIPLNRGGVGTTINLTVNAGMGTDGGDVGRQIVDALRQYERRNGPVPITVR